MLHQGQVQLGSPRNIIVNVLDANTFFTLDYEPDSLQNPKSKTNGFHAEQKGQKQKSRSSNTSHNNSYNLKDAVKSAQYNRKIGNIATSFRGINLYNRIKKVDDMIEERKKLINISLQQEVLRKSLEEPKQKILPSIKTLTDKKPQPLTEELKYRNYLFETLPLTDRSSDRKHQKNCNSFCDNYKNRRKLTDRIAHKKSSRSSGSPLRRDVSPAEYAEQRINDTKYWSPYRGKLVTNRNLQFLRQSVQGNKINYTTPDPVGKGERYLKNKKQ